MAMAAILVMWPWRLEQLLVPPTPGGYIWNLVTIGPVVSEEKSSEIVDGRRLTTEPADTISSPGAFGSGELKKCSIYKIQVNALDYFCYAHRIWEKLLSVNTGGF